MDLPQHRHQALVVNRPIFGGQFLPRPQLLQHVVHVRKRELRVQRLLPLAMRVELLAKVANAGGLRGRAVGKGEGIKTRKVLVTWSILQSPPARKGPNSVNSARKHAKSIIIT